MPVEIKAGYPAALRDITFPDDFDVIMLLSRYRHQLQQCRSGTRGLLLLRNELSTKTNPDRWIQVSDGELRSVERWAGTLLEVLDKHDPVESVLAVREDFLGVYRYETKGLFGDEYSVNKATIELYWGVIGLVSEWLNCSAADLTVVVLTHELAHAYTQLGADIEGRRWPASIFAAADRELKEGLAQYYTDRVLRRVEHRYAGALKVYQAMLPRQPEPYRVHENWVEEYSPESVRRAMLEVRRWKEGKISDFNKRIAEAKKQLQPEDQESE